MDNQPPKNSWLKAYTWVILANLLYILLFYILMTSF